MLMDYHHAGVILSTVSPRDQFSAQMGIIFATLQSSGTTPSSSDLLNMIAKGTDSCHELQFFWM